MKDFMYVAITKKDWDEFAQLQGLATVEIIDGVSTMTYVPEVVVDEIGSVQSEPGVYDFSGALPVVITPPVMDPRYHVNLRIPDDAVLEDYVSEGVPATANVTWVEPDTVETPVRVWAGGMEYYELPPVARKTKRKRK